MICETPAAVSDYLLLVGGDSAIAMAARDYAERRIGKIALIGYRPGRLQMLGVVATNDEIQRRHLVARGVQSDHILSLTLDAIDEWDVGRAVALLTHRHAQCRIVVLCDRFSSRLISHVLHAQTPESAVADVSITALRDRRYDETNWWRSKTGVKSFFGAWFDLTYALIKGDERASGAPLTPEQYERAALQ